MQTIVCLESQPSGPFAAAVDVEQSFRAGGPLIGKPNAGDPLVRFGGRGGREQSAFPTPIKCAEGENRACNFRGVEITSLHPCSPRDALSQIDPTPQYHS